MGAYFSALAIGARNLGDLGFDGARVTSIRVETEASVDDVLIETDAGGYIAIQAKTTVECTLGSRLGSVADQFVRYWLCASSGQAQYGWNRPLNPSTDRLFLVVGPEASKRIRVHLRDVLDVHRSGTLLHAQPEARREVFENFRGLLSQAWTKHTHRGATDDELRDLLNVCAVRELDLHGSDKRLAEEVLRTVLDDPDEAGTAFRGAQ
ncbi:MULTISPECIES: hypothetical protein [Paraburkholderia]|uniref:hypothetical protein n=1 Tax=Paraburkholderia TaxID=1822464 RepID=UPI0013A69690|nr:MULTISPECIES: hypothetical protein [Paraburkholderia]